MIEAVAYQKKLEGKSNAHLITFNDGKDYVVKFFQPGFEKTLPNEWISYCLGRYLGLPIPFSQIVNIPQEFLSQEPELAEIQYIPYQFASLYIPNCVDGHQVDTISTISNAQSLASIIVFDYWLYNGDRTRKNILLQKEKVSEDCYHLWAIDHAEVLGSYNWHQEDLEQLPTDLIKSATHDLMTKFITDEQQLLDQLHYIQTMPILLLEEVVTLIPDEWLVSKEDKKAIVTALVTRRKTLLPKMIERFIKKKYNPPST